MTEAALAGADIATVPPKILRQMMHHPLTESGIARFRQDWDAVHARQEVLGQAGAESDGLAHDREPWLMSGHG